MCGRYNIIDDPAVHELCRAVGIDVDHWPVRYNDDIRPTDLISIIREDENGRRIDNAVWWLLLMEQSEDWKPNTRYASFNTRSDKLNNPKSIGYKPFRETRCLIPASGFIEGLEGTKNYFLLQGAETAIAFGGLYKEWVHRKTGEIKYSASIITLPPHPKLKGIHEKSFPLMVNIEDQSMVNLWLSPVHKDVTVFEQLMTPNLVTGLNVTPIDRPSKRNPVGETFLIGGD